MMSPHILLWLLCSSLASAQSIVDYLSFGHKDTISSDGQRIEGWHVSSLNHNLQFLSDRVILTPPAPGNARGALWSERPVESETWIADFEFRTMGQDGGSGNLQVWFAKDKNVVDSNSVYTIEKFDGLALVIDQYGAGGGSIRGFLNDGTQDFRKMENLESLAFGHCPYSYRNLGRWSKLRITSHDGLTVSVDGEECFKSDKISLPSAYHFGITAATGETPDSFEVGKFVVTSGIPHEHRKVLKGGPPPLQRLDKLPEAPEMLPDRMADDIKGQEDRFADLHNRLQGLTRSVANIFGEIEKIGRDMNERHQQLMGAMPASSQESIGQLNRRLDSLERSIDQIKRDVEGKDYRENLNQLSSAIENVRGGLTESLPDTINGIISKSAPRMGMFVFIVLAVQILLAGAYIVYKRRRANMPKKYL